MIHFARILIVVLFCFGTTGSFGQQADTLSTQNEEPSFPITTTLLDSLFETAKKYLGTKYVYGGCSEKGFDCSGFIYYVFKQYSIELSRSAAALSQIGIPVALNELQEGDLLFFKGRNTSSNRVGHVSLVIYKTENSFEMIHATNRGVVVDLYSDMSYYKKRFLFARRFLKKE
jgi:cell wall-associated NlpC family hydrolase